MARFHRLEVPSFDLTWLNLTNFDEVALVAGGGGSFKSGVKNQIQIARVHDADKVTFVESFITDEDTKRRLCCGLACGSILVCYLRFLPLLVADFNLTRYHRHRSIQLSSHFWTQTAYYSRWK
jgi:hypothetical protein